MTKNAGTTVLKMILVLAGLFIIFTGLNVALGGMMTMGWQGQTGFLKVTNEHAYLVRDSHTRFLGAIWAGIGFIFLFATTNLKKHQTTLQAFCVLIFIGGLARLGQMNFSITFGPDIIGSVIAELVGIPLLYIWLTRAVDQ